ncbi:MAG: entericidin A/B family lipoprotein [Burkholderiales bacterium]|jgi:entericidin B
MKRLLLIAFALSLLSACNTLRGVGQDIKKTGEVIENAATKK